jgi:hypothetical protein
MVLERSNQIIEMFHKLENSNHFYLVDCRCSTAIGAITFLLMLMLKLICCEKKYCYFAEMVRLISSSEKPHGKEQCGEQRTYRKNQHGEQPNRVESNESQLDVKLNLHVLRF